jgi:hypothetical protein
VNRDRTALVAAIVMALGACAGSGSEATCEQALEHTASLAVARASPEGKPSPHAAAHQAALVRATGDSFLTRCRERSAANQAAFAGCVLSTDNLSAARACWSR